MATKKKTTRKKKSTKKKVTKKVTKKLKPRGGARPGAGRPELEPEERRSRSIKVALTEDEYQTICMMAEEAPHGVYLSPKGRPLLGSFVRDVVLYGRGSGSRAAAKGYGKRTRKSR